MDDSTRHGDSAHKKRAKLHDELARLMRDEHMEEGDSWFLVATPWWDQKLRLGQNGAVNGHASAVEDEGYAEHGDGDEAMDGETRRDDGDTDSSEVTNEGLVDLEFSSKKRKCVVLKPMLAEGRDYRLVSESVWNRLSHEFGYDWEIPREVIARGPTRKLIVEVYPVMFQVFYWRSGMDTPEEALDKREKPIVVAASESSRIQEVKEQIRDAMKEKAQHFFPQIAPKDLERRVQICYRESETAPWTTLNDAITPAETPKQGFQSSSSYTNRNAQPKASCVSDLELEQRDYRSGKERFHHLLVEARYRNAGDPVDWRNGKFYSEIKANEWRYELVLDQVIDGLDSDNKWYESRVIALNDRSVRIHYRGWTAKWDEWLPRTSERLAPLHTKVRNWRAFEVGDEVQVGFPIPGKNFPEWKNATVTELERFELTGALKIKVSIDDEETWMDAQDEMLCAPGTHKAVNAVTLATTNLYPRATPSPSYNSYGRYGDRGRDHSYEYGRGKPEFKGVVGLQNLGNTCFMNSMLQCLINAPPLKEYFLKVDEGTKKATFQKDINTDNPLGMKGMIAMEFASLVRKMWGGEYSVVSPTGLKSVIGQYAPQFAGYQQQDSQEVMNFLLDGLHEDLNRVKKKPYTEAVEGNGRDDVEVAREEWEVYLRRNDSVIVENFMGQLRSHLTCSNPDCGNESVTFDPFMSLSVPIPNEESVIVQVQLFWADGRIPMKYAIRLSKDSSTLRDVKDKLSELAGIPFQRLFFVEVWKHRILKALNDAMLVEDLREETLHAYELELPVSEYEFSSKSIQPPAAAKMALKSIDSSNGSDKPMRLVALLHQAPSASPMDDRYNGGEDLAEEEEIHGSKQRRVEVELFNTPLLVSIDRECTKADVHKKVWQIVKRLVSSSESSADSFGCEDNQTLPYRLHVSQPNGTVSIIRDFACSDEPADLPDPNERTHCFTVEWSRHRYQRGYDESSAKRIALHESMKNLRISSSPNNEITLLNCLAKFTEREQLGETDTWYCPKCKDHVRAFKKFDLFSLPKIMIFQLKRFRYAQSSFYMHRDKISTQVTFPIASLDLSQYVIGPQRSTPLIYDLFAVSEHSGGLGGGHYTAVAKNPENQRWFSFNDSFTNETTAQKAVTPRAYVLFYMRRE
ncbi:Ubiquitin-specific protease, partial [Globisporangium splendens]